MNGLLKELSEPISSPLICPIIDLLKGKPTKAIYNSTKHLAGPHILRLVIDVRRISHPDM